MSDSVKTTSGFSDNERIYSNSKMIMQLETHTHLMILDSYPLARIAILATKIRDEIIRLQEETG